MLKRNWFFLTVSLSVFIALVACQTPAASPTAAPAAQPTTAPAAAKPAPAAPATAAPAAQAVSSTGSPTTWRFQSVLGSSDPTPLAEKWWGQQMSDYTSGKFKLEFYEKTSLGFPGPQIYDVVGKGLLESSEMWAPHVASKFAWIDAMEQPGLVPHMQTRPITIRH